MPKPRLAIVFTGGTIAMRSAAGADRNVPTLGPADLLATAPGIGDLADVEAIDWGKVPASHLSFAHVLEIGRVLADQLARDDVDGAVVVQGTDVIEETAFAWDLLPLPRKPLIVVGAMRSASQPGYDGPANLLNAVGAAADARLSDVGVVVAMAGELHAADDVRKANSHDLDAFRSPNHGRVGTIRDGRVTLERARRPTPLPAIPAAAALPVPLLPYALETDPAALRAVEDPRPAGLVVMAAGGGNTPPPFLETARRLMRRGVPVALTTRAASGRAAAGYGFDGGSTQWWEAGALFTGTLDAYKARVLLALGLGAGASLDELAEICAAHGGGRVAAGAS